MATLSLGMIGVSIVVFLIAVILNDGEILNATVLPFTENVLAIFSVVFLVVGIFLAIFDRMRRKIHTRGHNFETRTPRFRRSG